MSGGACEDVICAEQGNVRFETRRAALRKGSQVRQKSGGETFAHECSHCGGWHTSQQSKASRQKRREAAGRHLTRRRAA